MRRSCHITKRNWFPMWQRFGVNNAREADCSLNFMPTFTRKVDLLLYKAVMKSRSCPHDNAARVAFSSPKVASRRHLDVLTCTLLTIVGDEGTREVDNPRHSRAGMVR